MNLIVDFPQAPREELLVDFPRPRRATFPQNHGILDVPQTPRTLGLGTRRPPPTSSRVSFSDRMNVTLVEDLSLKYKTDLWFSRQEMDSFKQQASLLLKSITSNGMTVAQYADVHVEDTSAFMGLEGHMTPSATCRIRERRRDVGRAVWLEQWRQNEAGIFDPDAMKQASQAITGESFPRARVIAMLHASNVDDRGEL